VKPPVMGEVGEASRNKGSEDALSRSDPSEPGDLGGEVRFTARMYVEHYLATRGLTLGDLEVAPTMVGTWFRGVTRRLTEATGATQCERWLYPEDTGHGAYTARVDGQAVSFITYPVGAPATVTMMEELAAAGVRRFIGLGMCGSLQETVPVGSVVLPGRCVREEGTSAHYVPPEEEVGPHPPLAGLLGGLLHEAGLRPVAGPHWTTDAPYREYIWKIERYRSEGVIAVDMETSAMYAFGRARGLEVANVLVVSDELWREWRPGFWGEELRQAFVRVVTVLAEGLGRLALPLDSEPQRSYNWRCNGEPLTRG